MLHYSVKYWLATLIDYQLVIVLTTRYLLVLILFTPSPPIDSI